MSPAAAAPTSPPDGTPIPGRIQRLITAVRYGRAAAARNAVIRKTRHQALYIQLPFEMAPVVADYPRIVVPPRQGTRYDGLPPVHIRFHTTTDNPRTVDDRALSVATTRKPTRRTRRAARRLQKRLQQRH